jgi:hypothetical protein
MFNTEALRNELRSGLRGYSGMDAAKLLKCPNLLRALDTNDGDEAVERLVAKIHKISPARNREALLNALAVPNTSEVPEQYAQAQKTKDWQQSLTHRREWFGQQWGGKNHETVETWENEAINYLITLLFDPTMHPRANSLRIIIVLSRDLIVKAVDYYAQFVKYWGEETQGFPMQDYPNDTMTGARWRLPFFVYDIDDLIPDKLELNLWVPQEITADYRWPSLIIASSFTDALNNSGRRLNMEGGNSFDGMVRYRREIVEPKRGSTILVSWIQT